MDLLRMPPSFKPTCEINSQYNCGEITFKDATVLCDITDMTSLINKNVQTREKAIYMLFAFNPDIDYINFINDDVDDIRRNNVEIKRLQKFAHLMKDYKVIEYVGGHISSMGIHANKLKNPMWKAIDSSGNDVILMYCETNTICVLCSKSYEIIKEYEKTTNDGNPITWYVMENKYICCRFNLYIHQVITGCYGNGKGTGTISVDHKNRNKHDNRFDNLHIATRKEQENNSYGILPDTKRTRQTGARELPDGITQDMLKKYVVYNVGYLSADRTKWRDFFSVEGHPALSGKTWTTTKSMKVTAYQKLMDANKVVDNLNNGIMPTSVSEQAKTVITSSDEIVTLPKYIRISNARSKPHLELDKRNDSGGPRISLKMILPENYEITTELSKFIQKVITKYPELTSLYTTKTTNAEEDSIL
jgi:hypothetical protein